MARQPTNECIFRVRIFLLEMSPKMTCKIAANSDLQVKMSATSRSIQECPPSYTNCGICKCVPKGVSVLVVAFFGVLGLFVYWLSGGFLNMFQKFSSQFCVEMESTLTPQLSGVCGQCPNIIALSLSALDSYAEPGFPSGEPDPFANLSNKSMSNWSEEAEPLPYPPSQAVGERGWGGWKTETRVCSLVPKQRWGG